MFTNTLDLQFFHRALASLLMALLFTMGLFALMHLLIDEEYREVPRAHTTIDKIWFKEPIITVIKEEELKTLEPVETPPVVPVSPVEFPKSTAGTTLSLTELPRDPVVVSPNLQDGEPIPYIRVAPLYPQRQLSLGREGFVDLAFSITKSGATSNVRVIYAEPERVFDKAAVKAVKKWKYKPLVKNGEATQKDGLSTRVRFKIQD